MEQKENVLWWSEKVCSDKDSLYSTSWTDFGSALCKKKQSEKTETVLNQQNSQ